VSGANGVAGRALPERSEGIPTSGRERVEGFQSLSFAAVTAPTSERIEDFQRRPIHPLFRCAARRKASDGRSANSSVSDFVTPTVGPDQWVVATLICLFVLSSARELFER